MPLFEFHCPLCDKDFEELVRSADDASSVACPHCGKTGASRKLSVFAAHGAATPTNGASFSPGACGRCGDPNGPCS